jgi:ATP-dependent RNA helicase DeaD
MNDVTQPVETRDTFDVLALSPEVRRAIDELGFVHPTPVQKAAFEPALTGADLIVQARTGTGKTLAFGLPLVDRLVAEGHGLQALILAPTRELALQSQRALEQVGKYKGLRTTAVYGGAPMDRQITELRHGAEIVSGTPGRVLDHIRRGTLDPSGVRVLVLDEADEMFSMGFAKELNAIMDALPSSRQFLCFSATMDESVQRMAERRMREPEFIALSSDQVGASEISHFFYMVLGDKLGALVRVLENEDPESAIIFCNTKADTETVARQLSAQGFNADWLNGDLPQREREKIMARTREGKLRYMVATDVAARGIDISHLTHVINYGFPESAEQYVHRTGRTGRAGRTGTAISVLGPSNLGALYLMRLTYKIFPIERSLPSASELKTQKESDRLALLDGAFRAAPLDEHREVVRRLLTHPDAERLLAGLVRSFFEGQTGDVDELAAAARRDRPPAVVLTPAAASDVDDEDSSDGDGETEPGPSGGKRKRRRRRGARSEGQNPVAAEAAAILGTAQAQRPDRAAPAAPQAEDEPPAAQEPDDLPPSAALAEAPPVLEDMTLLYFNVGRRDGLEPTDLADLLNSSCGLGADDIGRVRVKERHTFVGVPTERVDFVISSLQGQTIKNRQLQVERART